MSWNPTTPSLLSFGLDNGHIWIEMFNKLSYNSSDCAAFFNYHKKPITSIQFNPNNDSELIVSSEDDTVTTWDLSVEDEKPQVINGIEIPSNLMFDHRGMKKPKEVTYDKNIKDLIIVTGIDGFNVYQPDDTED